MQASTRAVRIQVTDLAYTYPGPRPIHALDGVNLAVYDHEFLALLGPVGCGKTTLLRTMAGFLTPTRGAVLCDGVSVSRPGRERGYVFQEEAIFPWMTVRDNVEFGLLAKGVDAAERAAIVREWIELTGLRGYEAAYPKELSAGMSKMVELARMLATDPAILLLDEPFGSLDAQTRERMQETLSRLWERRRKTVVFVTHDVEEAIYLADRIVVLSPRPGRVKSDGRVDLARPRSRELKFSPQFLELKRKSWGELGLA